MSSRLADASARDLRAAREEEWRRLERIVVRAERKSPRALSDEDLMELPVLGDMLTICTSAGLALEQALNAVARQSGGLTAQELQQVSREVALDRVWGSATLASFNAVDRYISYLRRKLGEPPLIETVRGIGFVLTR